MTDATNAGPSADGAITREELHFRRIDMRGWRRSDGLYEIEGRVTDRKPYDFSPGGGERSVPAHDAIHDMGVALVFDERMVVRAVRTFTEAMPYAECAGGGLALQAITGLRIGSGWSRAVKSRVGGAASCTHLMELLIPMATAALQAMSAIRQGQADPLDANGKPLKIDSCYAYRADGEQVARRWPQFVQTPTMQRR